MQVCTYKDILIVNYYTNKPVKTELKTVCQTVLCKIRFNMDITEGAQLVHE